MPPELIMSGAILLLAGLLFAALMAQWLNAQAMVVAIPPKTACGFTA